MDERKRVKEPGALETAKQKYYLDPSVTLAWENVVYLNPGHTYSTVVGFRNSKSSPMSLWGCSRVKSGCFGMLPAPLRRYRHCRYGLRRKAISHLQL